MSDVGDWFLSSNRGSEELTPKLQLSHYSFLLNPAHSWSSEYSALEFLNASKGVYSIVPYSRVAILLLQKDTDAENFQATIW